VLLVLAACGVAPVQSTTTPVATNTVMPSETLRPTDTPVEPTQTPIIGVHESIQGVTFNFFGVSIASGAVLLGNGNILKGKPGYSVLCINATYTGDIGELLNGPFKTNQSKGSLFITDAFNNTEDLANADYTNTNADFCFFVVAEEGPYMLHYTVAEPWSLDVASLDGGSLLLNAKSTLTPEPTSTKSPLQNGIGWYSGGGDNSLYSISFMVSGSNHDGLEEFQIDGFTFHVNQKDALGWTSCTEISLNDSLEINPDGSFSTQTANGNIAGKLKKGTPPSFTGTYSTPNCGNGKWTAMFSN